VKCGKIELLIDEKIFKDYLDCFLYCVCLWMKEALAYIWAVFSHPGHFALNVEAAWTYETLVS
jgi:hypothetical protein